MQHNTKQTCTVSVFQNIKQLCPANNNKTSQFYKPCIYDKQLGFNKPAAVIADSLFADSAALVF